MISTGVLTNTAPGSIANQLNIKPAPPTALPVIWIRLCLWIPSPVLLLSAISRRRWTDLDLVVDLVDMVGNTGKSRDAAGNATDADVHDSSIFQIQSSDLAWEIIFRSSNLDSKTVGTARNLVQTPKVATARKPVQTPEHLDII